MFAHPQPHPRCLVYLLGSYISKLPFWAKANDVFYARPVKIPPENASELWYQSAPVSKGKTVCVPRNNVCGSWYNQTQD